LFKFHSLQTMNRISFIRFFALFICFLFASLTGLAQSRTNQLIQVLVTPDKADWNYALGEEASFTATILKHHVPIENAQITYSIGLEKMQPMQTGSTNLTKGATAIGKKIKLNEPGFLRC